MPDQPRSNGDTVLVAFVTAHLQSGESFELLPFEDPEDVKSKVSDLLADWAKSGFLIQGSQIHPWHQVLRVEATEVVELSRADSLLRRQEWQSRDLYRLQQSFWRTKKERGKKDEEIGKEKGGEAQRPR